MSVKGIWIEFNSDFGFADSFFRFSSRHECVGKPFMGKSIIFIQFDSFPPIFQYIVRRRW